MTRHYGMDWLRIAAFALLILYHIGMVFVPWNFHVKSPNGEDWTRLPMMATNAWRLPLLFVVSGYATRALIRRSDGLGAFLANRSWRLLVPLAFGIAVIVPPQPWVELVTKRGYAHDFLYFWAYDYFRFGKLGGIVLPTWNHLWFIGYLWVYTLGLALLVAIVRGEWLQRWFDRAFGGWGVIVIPMAWALAVHAWWFPMAGETHMLIDDTMAHFMYVPYFLFGFGLARSAPAMAALRRLWPVAAAIALAGFATVLLIEYSWPPDVPTPRWVLRPYGAAHALQQWGAIAALLGVADRWLNRDGPARTMLTEAVFPFYIIHQTIIVLVMFWLLPRGLSGPAQFAILVVATVAGCWAFYLGGRAMPFARPLIGLRPRSEMKGQMR
ncbi:acyltransferase family protein [uncultured Sphingomonas sp.]|uniref:acyltransferase family protein n=1 Tax=uncultured Sphingomonas sp. TaxID=158754 RepID=UPI00261AFC79|nr:acyltransferase family protein [uncultured Sphingomonas sp.]